MQKRSGITKLRWKSERFVKRHHKTIIGDRVGKLSKLGSWRESYLMSKLGIRPHGLGFRNSQYSLQMSTDVYSRSMIHHDILRYTIHIHTPVASVLYLFYLVIWLHEGQAARSSWARGPDLVTSFSQTFWHLSLPYQILVSFRQFPMRICP